MAVLAPQRVSSHPWPAWFGIILAFIGLAVMVASQFAPLGWLFPERWAVEPLAYIGIAGVVVGLSVAVCAYLLSAGSHDGSNGFSSTDDWSRLTEQQFETFQHDLGRPMRRILGKCREARGVLAATGEDVSVVIHELLDEIEEQAPSFRLMMANIQVMINLETPDAAVERYPVEPPAVVSRIVERYTGQAIEQGKDIAWWSEPEDFGLVYSDATALEHIIANLVDNALRYGGDYIEITVTRDTRDFQVRVTDDGPGIPVQYRSHLFVRGWTPEMGRSEEKTSSGLGLYISRTLARRYGGDLTVESTLAEGEGPHTVFTLTLPVGAPDA